MRRTARPPGGPTMLERNGDKRAAPTGLTLWLICADARSGRAGARVGPDPGRGERLERAADIGGVG